MEHRLSVAITCGFILASTNALALPSVVESVYPPDDAAEVPINAPLIMDLTVDAAVHDWTSGVALYRAADDSLVEYVSLERENLVDPRTVVVAFVSRLDTYTDYYVVILRDAFQLTEAPYGYAGDYLSPAGDMTDPALWNFTTGDTADPAFDDMFPDAELPTIVDAVFPADDSLGVSIDAPLELALSVAVSVDEWTTDLAVFHADDDSLVEAITLGPDHLVDSHNVSVQLSAPLDPDTEYYVVIYRKALRVAEAPWGYIGDYTTYFDGDSLDPTMWNFRTAGATGGGKIVAYHDDWALSSPGLALAPGGATFAQNIAAWFTGGESGSFLAYSNHFGLNSAQLSSVFAGDGHSWTVTTSLPQDLATLEQFDGVFLVGTAFDNQVLIDYVEGGGNVYVAGGTGVGGTVSEAAQWNGFLNYFGLEFLPFFNRVFSARAVDDPHPVTAGVSSLYTLSGLNVRRLDPDDSCTAILQSFFGNDLLAVFDGDACAP